jgi:hypothetical protein
MAWVTRLAEMSMPTLVGIVAETFNRITDPRKYERLFSLKDILMSGFAMFSLKFPSLLMFNNERDKPVIRYNLKELFGVEQAPCDTQMRRILDLIEPEEIEDTFRAILQHLKKLPIFEHYRLSQGSLVIAIDGVEHHCSNEISCDSCCQRTLKNGQIQYYHQALVAVIVHPDLHQVIPVAIEPILRLSNQSKNMAELTAIVQLLRKIRKILQEEKIIITLDALYGKGPCVKLLKKMNFNYIIVVKESDHVSLFDTVRKKMQSGETTEFETTEEDGRLCGYRYINRIGLNKTYPHLMVNYLDYWEVSKKDKKYNCIWITDIHLNSENVQTIMRGGRVRWKIENETFNALKNKGYEFGHNYGHGKKNLATVMMMLMFLAFLVDQIQELGCILFKEARYHCRSRKVLWEKLRGLFSDYFIEGWEVLWLTLSEQHQKGRLSLNTS